jgi:hypothetical protein
MGRRPTAYLGVEKRARSIRIYFRDPAKACRESLDLYSSPANLKYATRLRQRICDDIRAGCVDYPQYFPVSPRVPQIVQLTFGQRAEIGWRIALNLRWPHKEATASS